MIGILVELIISWILLYLIEKKSILSLGFTPITDRLKQFIIGFLITAILCISVESLEMLLSSSRWHWNESASVASILAMFWWDFTSVVTEELLFRGALLVILIERIGARKGSILSAIAFGVYHWFSFGILGNIVPMFFVFVGTGVMGYAWAWAFSKTKSIFLPIGLHLGWNFTFNTIFSKGPLQNGLLVSEGGHILSDWFSLIGLWAVPAIVLIVISYWPPKAHTEITDKKAKTIHKVV